jgi:hypothetical protein
MLELLYKEVTLGKSVTITLLYVMGNLKQITSYAVMYNYEYGLKAFIFILEINMFRCVSNN